jgi:hypothetical protein
MATRRLDMSSYKIYLNKRNWILITVVFGFFLLLGLGFFAYFVESTLQDFFQAMVFILGVAYLIGLLVAKQMMFTISMYTHYYRMIEEDMPTFDVDIHPYMATFSQQLTHYQFILGVDRPLYQIHYRIFPRLPYVKRTGLSIIWFVITKDEIDSYDSRIEDDVIYIKSKIPQAEKLQNELTFIFHETQAWRDSKKTDAQKIVNFHIQNRAMISIPCVVITSKKQVYALRPNKQFPNKYYYVAIQFLKEITAAKIT